MNTAIKYTQSKTVYKREAEHLAFGNLFTFGIPLSFIFATVLYWL